MKKQTFYKAVHKNDKDEWEAVEAIPINFHGIELFGERVDRYGYRVSHAHSGYLLVSDSTKRNCMQELERVYQEDGPEKFKENINGVIKASKEKFGPNPKYSGRYPWNSDYDIDYYGKHPYERRDK